MLHGVLIAFALLCGALASSVTPRLSAVIRGTNK
jgi:hypothetical protein